ncbi:MAG: hypothetical protein PHY40_03715 [Patescibacteria group bacterium]|nr:hypothetical protein [Patescibacteria group bacterium]
MFEYLQKFNKLPKELRDKVAGPAAMAIINDLEKKYSVSLATVVLKIMVKDILAKDLPLILADEFKLDKKIAENLANDLKEKIFYGLEDYLEWSKNPEAVVLVPKENNVPAREISPIKPIAPVQIKGASFSFSPEDEEEIRKLAKKLGESGQIVLVNNELNKNIEAVINKTNIKFSSEFLLKRFRQIISTYLKNVRDRLDTKLVLAKDVGGGGLGLDEGAVNRILLIADEVLKKNSSSQIKPPVKMAVPEDLIKGELSAEKITSLKSIGARDIDYDYSKLPKKSPTPPAQAAPAKQEVAKKIELDTEHELAPLPPVVIGATKPQAISPNTKIVKVADIFKRNNNISDGPVGQGESLKPKIQARKPSEPTGKTKIEDVKHVPRVMSPIDELGYMSMVNFRRLAKNPFDAVAKIKEKIKLLEEERYSKKIEGIRAWRSSIVNRLYLEIGALSISQGKPIDVIIEERKKAGFDVLTAEEFEAILRLNKEIRF